MKRQFQHPSIFIAFLFSIIFITSCSRNNDTNNNNNTTGCVSGTGATDIDGNTYTSVKIGTQEWLVENLKVTKYKNGNSIPNVTTNSQWAGLTTGAWCYYNNDAQYNSPYGKLYNWYAATDPRGLAPTGWHIPSDAEWTTLVTFLGGTTVAGGKMKEMGLVHWVTDNGGSGGTTNSSCFTGLPGGFRNNDINALFNNMGNYGYWWSSTDAAAAGAWWFVLNHNNPQTDRGTAPKPIGYSVRCIKD